MSTSGHWAFSMTLGLFTPSAFTNITWKTYVVFGVFNAAMFIHVFFMFPETAGKTLEETEAMFEDPNGIEYLGNSGLEDPCADPPDRRSGNWWPRICQGSRGEHDCPRNVKMTATHESANGEGWPFETSGMMGSLYYLQRTAGDGLPGEVSWVSHTMNDLVVMSLYCTPMSLYSYPLTMPYAVLYPLPLFISLCSISNRLRTKKFHGYRQDHRHRRKSLGFGRLGSVAAPL